MLEITYKYCLAQVTLHLSSFSRLHSDKWLIAGVLAQMSPLPDSAGVYYAVHFLSRYVSVHVEILQKVFVVMLDCL